MLQPDPIQFIVALDPKGRALMTRDMDLIRHIFVEIRRREDAEFRTLEIDGVDQIALIRHLEMLLKAGLIEGVCSAPINGLPVIVVKDLSWQGHDFAGALAEDSVWKKIKETYSSDLSKLPLSVIAEVAKGFISKWALLKAGLS